MEVLRLELNIFRAVPQPLSKRSKDRKKKKLKSIIQASTSTIAADGQTDAAPETIPDENIEDVAGMLDEFQCFLRTFTFEYIFKRIKRKLKGKQLKAHHLNLAPRVSLQFHRRLKRSRKTKKSTMTIKMKSKFRLESSKVPVSKSKRTLAPVTKDFAAL
jgi:hypothetical protein